MFKRLLSLSLLIWAFVAQAETFVAGKDYELIPYPLSKPDPAHVKVVEFFSYGCPWCYKVEPQVEKWVSNNKTQFEFHKIPAIFHKEWLPYAKAYHLLETLSLTPKISPLIFKTIMDEKKPLDTDTQMMAFLEAQGLDKTTVKSAFENSPSMDMMIQEDTKLMAIYRVNSIPSFLVNQQYKTDLKMAGNEKRLFLILDFLVKEAQHKKA